MRKFYIFIISFSLSINIIPAFSASCIAGFCSSSEDADACGPDARGHKCEINSRCVYKCTCTSSNKEFQYNVGCVCKSGTYGSSCTACPSSGSSAAGSSAITNCYKYMNTYVASAHATLNTLCYYSTGTGGYTNCQSSGSVVSCDGGYYRATTTATSCVAVGTNYYSVSPLSRAICPTYTNNSGSAVTGITTGSGAGADAITDCMIPRSEYFTNSKGSYSYNTCYYSN